MGPLLTRPNASSATSNSSTSLIHGQSLNSQPPSTSHTAHAAHAARASDPRTSTPLWQKHPAPPPPSSHASGAPPMQPMQPMQFAWSGKRPADAQPGANNRGPLSDSPVQQHPSKLGGWVTAGTPPVSGQRSVNQVCWGSGSLWILLLRLA